MQRLHRDDSYLGRSIFEATLAELQQAKRDLDHSGPAGAMLQRFFSLDWTELYFVSSEHPAYDLPQIHRTLQRCFADWSLLRVLGPARRSCPWIPERRQVRTGPSHYERILVDGSLWFELPGGERRAAFIEEAVLNDRENGCRFTIVGTQQRSTQIDLEIERLCRAMDDDHYLRGQVIDVEGEVLSIAADVGWESIFLAAGVRERLLANTRDFLEQRPLFAKAGVPWKRGILLYGPPGTGKTMIGKALANEGLANFLYGTAADCGNPNRMRALFSLARRLRPAILFLEDLDLFGDCRNARSDRPVLGELLAQLDGMVSDDGLIVVATTNDLSAIDTALSQRPSRFDVVLEITLPDAVARRGILGAQLGEFSIGDALLEELVTSTNGCSGARVRELAIVLMQEVLLRCRCKESAEWVVQPDDVQVALERTLAVSTKRTVAGFCEARAGQDAPTRARHQTRRSQDARSVATALATRAKLSCCSGPG